MRSFAAAVVLLLAVAGVALLGAGLWRWWRRPDRRRRAPWFNRPLLPHESGERMFRRMLERIEKDSRRPD